MEVWIKVGSGNREQNGGMGMGMVWKSLLMHVIGNENGMEISACVRD